MRTCLMNYPCKYFLIKDIIDTCVYLYYIYNNVYSLYGKSVVCNNKTWLAGLFKLKMNSLEIIMRLMMYQMTVARAVYLVEYK